MVVFPDGKLALTTPDDMSAQQLNEVGGIVKSWLDGDVPVLVVGRCQVVLAAAGVEEVAVGQRTV